MRPSPSSATRISSKASPVTSPTAMSSPPSSEVLKVFEAPLRKLRRSTTPLRAPSSTLPTYVNAPFGGVAAWAVPTVPTPARASSAASQAARLMSLITRCPFGVVYGPLGRRRAARNRGEPPSHPFPVPEILSVRGSGSAQAIELGGDFAHVGLDGRKELAESRRQTPSETGDDRERVVHRRAEGRGGQALRVVGRLGEGARDVRVADAFGDQLQRDVLELDLDPGLQATPRACARSASWRRIGSLSADSAS